MPTSIDLKKGSLLLLDGDPFTVLETTVQTPSARGGATLVKLKAKNIRTKQIFQGRISRRSHKLRNRSVSIFVQ